MIYYPVVGDSALLVLAFAAMFSSKSNLHL